MLAGINAALEQGVFTLEPSPVDTKMYCFSLGDLPVVAQAHDASFDEVGLAVMVRPNELALKSARLFIPDKTTRSLKYGEACAGGWLERRNGKWLQKSPSLFTCRNELKPILAAFRIEPHGYDAIGRFMM
jgi:hypothetical protein